MSEPKNPRTDREMICKCGHRKGKHSPSGCLAPVETSMRGGFEICPCPAFTPKKEDRK